MNSSSADAQLLELQQQRAEWTQRLQQAQQAHVVARAGLGAAMLDGHGQDARERVDAALRDIDAAQAALAEIDKRYPLAQLARANARVAAHEAKLNDIEVEIAALDVLLKPHLAAIAEIEGYEYGAGMLQGGKRAWLIRTMYQTETRLGASERTRDRLEWRLRDAGQLPRDV